MKTKTKIAILVHIGNIEGGGGIERMYLNLIRLVNTPFINNIHILTTKKGKENALKFLPDLDQNRIKVFPLIENRFSLKIASIYCSAQILKYKYSIVHIANFDAYFSELYTSLSRLTKLTMNIVDCRFEPEYMDKRYDTIKHFISKGNLSGVYSWYKNAEKPVHELNPKIYFLSAKVCFTDNIKFKPNLTKEKIIVFAARLTYNKRPFDFIKAINICLKEDAQLFEDWRFILWGSGELANDVDEYISQLGLYNRILRGYSFDMSEIFNKSSVFVSTQMYENFTSLSMLEAMASGNSIVSYNLGQTDYFVRDGVNGLLAQIESPEALAECLVKIVKNPDLLYRFMKESVEIAKNIHNVTNFASELEFFCSNVINENDF